jgi:sterol desaturase/sphingolipid hydroxylase (fatty acid hydroxylase superfamily)
MEERMPTPIEILLDPVSIIVLLIYAGLMLAEYVLPGNRLPKVPGWRLRSLVTFVSYFFLSTYLPLLWDAKLSAFQIFDLSDFGVMTSTIVAVLVFEFLVYVWHRSMHRHPLLWRVFHQMHHSAERLETAGAFYFSPADMIGFTMIGSLSLVVIVGIPPESATYFLYITMFLGIFQHTNIRTPRWLGYFIQRPESHSVHHQKGVHRYNYSDLPLFDILFGTFKNPAEFVSETGFYSGASGRVGDMLMAKDVSRPNT